MEIFHFNCVLLGMELHKSPCCFGLSALWLNCWSTRLLWIRFRRGNIIKNTIRNNFKMNIIVEISHVGLNEKNGIISTAERACGWLWLFLIAVISAFCGFYRLCSFLVHFCFLFPYVFNKVDNCEFNINSTSQIFIHSKHYAVKNISIRSYFILMKYVLSFFGFYLRMSVIYSPNKFPSILSVLLFVLSINSLIMKLFENLCMCLLEGIRFSWNMSSCKCSVQLSNRK